MNELRYETHIPSDLLLPFVLYSNMTISTNHFNPIPNWHDDLEILNCRAGEGYIIMDGKKISFSVGDTILVCPLIIHNVFSKSSVSFFVITPGRDFCAANGIDTDQLMYPEKIRDASLDQLANELETYYNSDVNLRTAKMRCVMLEIMVYLTEKYGFEADKSGTRRKVEFVRIRNAIRFIRDNYERCISLDEVAKNVGINKFTLMRDFKELTGMTIISYLNNYRCRVAYELICAGMNVSEAAERCGFNNLSYFSKTFVKNIGELPSKSK